MAYAEVGAWSGRAIREGPSRSATTARSTAAPPWRGVPMAARVEDCPAELTLVDASRRRLTRPSPAARLDDTEPAGLCR
jgi:hypothetical protein